MDEFKSLWLLELSGGYELDLGLLSMSLEVKAGPIGAASDLNPAIGGLDFGIPAVLGIMGHFIASVLSESNRIFPDSNIFQEDVSPSHEICHCLVPNGTFFDSLAHGQVSDDSSISLLVSSG